MFHIVFDSRGTELLSAAMDLDETLDGETIFFTDDYSVGPIHDLFSGEGKTERKAWWSLIRDEREKNLPVEKMESSDAEVLQHIMKRMEEEEFDQIWIWAAPNARDICGYYWLIAQLGSFSGRIYVIHLNNLPFIKRKGNCFLSDRFV